LAIDSTSCESRKLPPWPGDDIAAAIGRAAGADGLDALLPGTRHGGGRLARMETIRTVAWMKERARAARQEQRLIGLVPTMGALHAGHLALVERARRECSPVYASIFLNPKQFSANEDLSRYPRPLEADVEKLTAAKVDGLFLPEAGEIYPAGFSTYVHVEGISERLEGKSRAGHFRGVSTVVLKLLEIVQPHFAYF